MAALNWKNDPVSDNLEALLYPAPILCYFLS
jgi:hypothetical protein